MHVAGKADLEHHDRFGLWHLGQGWRLAEWPAGMTQTSFSPPGLSNQIAGQAFPLN